eukprot:scaffold29089_cov20-Tisochrysis_lutea.AAC.1
MKPLPRLVQELRSPCRALRRSCAAGLQRVNIYMAEGLGGWRGMPSSGFSKSPCAEKERAASGDDAAATLRCRGWCKQHEGFSLKEGVVLRLSELPKKGAFISVTGTRAESDSQPSRTGQGRTSSTNSCAQTLLCSVGQPRACMHACVHTLLEQGMPKSVCLSSELPTATHQVLLGHEEDGPDGAQGASNHPAQDAVVHAEGQAGAVAVQAVIHLQQQQPWPEQRRGVCLRGRR